MPRRPVIQYRLCAVSLRIRYHSFLPNPLETVFTTHPTIRRYIIQATKIVVLNKQSINRTHYRLQSL